MTSGVIGEFEVRIWPPGAFEPDSCTTPVHDELALDRELLAVHDASASRAANAPRLRPVSATELELSVPAQSARPVLAISGVRFEALQAGIPPAREPWKIAPRELGQLGRLVCSKHGALALVRHIHWDRPGPTHHLAALPRTRTVHRGDHAVILAPALLVIGDAAVDITPLKTAVPISAPITPHDPALLSFRLGEIEAQLDHLEQLTDFVQPPISDTLCIPDWDGELRPSELPTAAAYYLERARRPFAFLPALEAGRRARLALAYRRADGTARLLVSGSDLNTWLSELTTCLSQPRRARTQSSRPPPPAIAPIAQAASLPEPARFRDIQTHNPNFAKALDALARVAPSELCILFLGESGTGKEHLAQAVHAASPPRRRPLHRRQLLCHCRPTHRKRTLRPPPRRLHRSPRRSRRRLRQRRRRNATPRRNRRRAAHRPARALASH